MKPLVSIISPVYNAMPYLNDFLDSVEKQTYSPLQLILVDDGSSDDSLAVLKARAKVMNEKGISTQVLSQKNAGQVAAVNLALPLVNGELLIWCDADDYWMEDSIEKMAECLLTQTDVNMVRCDGQIIDETENPILFNEKENQSFLSDIFDELFHERILLLAGRFMIRTHSLFSCYPNRQVPYSTVDQNFQLLLPVASKSKCAYLNEKLHVYCRRSTGDSSKKRSFTESLKRIEHIKQMYLSILPYCECDQAHYINRIDYIVNNYKQKLLKTSVTAARQSISNNT